mmetsp:Transcript_12176/g.37123  ORF Transcript_12176/g.37123 Transcript_12176/m.37123 type:complete len:96 (+) Transcript_12176:201-488(+)
MEASVEENRRLVQKIQASDGRRSAAAGQPGLRALDQGSHDGQDVQTDQPKKSLTVRQVRNIFERLGGNKHLLVTLVQALSTEELITLVSVLEGPA